MWLHIFSACVSKASTRVIFLHLDPSPYPKPTWLVQGAETALAEAQEARQDELAEMQARLEQSAQAAAADLDAAALDRSLLLGRSGPGALRPVLGVEGSVAEVMFVRGAMEVSAVYWYFSSLPHHPSFFTCIAKLEERAGTVHLLPSSPCKPDVVKCSVVHA